MKHGITRLVLVATIMASFSPLLWNCYEHKEITHEETIPKMETIKLKGTRKPLFPVDLDMIDFRFLSHAIIDERNKLLICTIPKVASSEWKKLFLRMQGDPNWKEEPWWKMRNLTTLYKVGMRRAMEIMTDETWTKGVFFRDPLKRLLSCYMDKFTNGTERSLKYSLKVFKADHVLSFTEFLDYVSSDEKNGIKVPQNVHWRQQVDICQIGKLWHLYNVHGNFEKLTEHARVLLQRAGLWDQYGVSGYGEDGQHAIFEHNQAAHRSSNRSEYDEATSLFSSKWSSHLSASEAVELLVEHDRNSPSSEGNNIMISSNQGTKTSLNVEAMLKRLKFKYKDDYNMFSQIDSFRRRSSSVSLPSIKRNKLNSEFIHHIENDYETTPFNASLYFSPKVDSIMKELPINTHQGFTHKKNLKMYSLSKQLDTQNRRLIVNAGGETTVNEVYRDNIQDDDEVFLNVRESNPHLKEVASSTTTT